MSSFRDDYNDIYERYMNSGFKFNYNNRRLGRTKEIFQDEMEQIPLTKRNFDDIALFVYCKKCGVYMDYNDEWWTCPVCRSRVRETTVYRQLDRDNDIFLEKNFSEEEPECCQACGGPWPDCESSCKLFDD